MKHSVEDKYHKLYGINIIKIHIPKAYPAMYLMILYFSFDPFFPLSFKLRLFWHP